MLDADTSRLRKSLRALRETGLGRLVVAGGVGANAALRTALNAACTARGIRVHYPELHLCTDNGAMIAMAAAMRGYSLLKAVSGREGLDQLRRDLGSRFTKTRRPTTEEKKAA